jgi:hypothetical protein
MEKFERVAVEGLAPDRTRPLRAARCRNSAGASEVCVRNSCTDSAAGSAIEKVLRSVL